MIYWGHEVQFQDTLNLFDPFSVEGAQQRALQLEKHMNRKANSGGAWSGNSPNNRGGRSNSTLFRAFTPLVQNPKSSVSAPPARHKLWDLNILLLVVLSAGKLDIAW